MHPTSGNEFKYKEMESERTPFDRKGHFQRRITYTKSHKKLINAIIKESILKIAKKKKQASIFFTLKSFKIRDSQLPVFTRIKSY